ncbi:MAG: T9SS type A sorting domain-containing protein [Algicola sp.]|nr:T9SS type A sorting domain-containing protein [Algicola sp.]
MKTKLLMTLMFLIGMTTLNAQTTHNLDWFAGMGSSVDLTIDVGDTVMWTWTSPNHTVENVSGSSVETFNSGFLGPTGSTYSYTFTVVGDNDYFCGVHGAGSMSGTITVEDNLSVDDLDNPSSFNVYPTPTDDILNIKIGASNSSLEVFDVLGKVVLTKVDIEESLNQLDVSNWHSGIYIIKVSVGNTTTLKRFVKK